MKIVVTGGAGFIGSRIADALVAFGHSVLVLDNLSSGSRDNVPLGARLLEVDITDANAVAGAFAHERPDAVCHQAAQTSVSVSVRDPFADARVNCLGTISVLDAAVKAGCKRVVFASSGGVLYGNVLAAPATETAAPKPVSPYGFTKWLGERYLGFYAKQYGISAVALRYANVYGPLQNPHGEAGVVAIFCKRLLDGMPATIHGDGSCVRDYVFCEDVARANVIALTSSAARVPQIAPGTLACFNVGTGIGTDVATIESMVRRRVAMRTGERPPEPVRGPARTGDLSSSIVDASLARRVLGWKPMTSLEDGIAETVEWFVKQREAV